MVVGPELDGGQSEAIDVYELAQPRPGAIVEAHEITAVRLIPGQFLPWVRGAADGPIEVVVDPRILVALDEERVEAGAGARRPLRRQIDVAQQPAVVGIVHVHRPQQLEHSRWDLRQNVTLDRGNVVVDRKSTRLNSSHVSISYA